MQSDRPHFEIEQNVAPVGWTVVAVWPDDTRERLTGLFVSSVHARRWLLEGAGLWLDQRRASEARADAIRTRH